MSGSLSVAKRKVHGLRRGWIDRLHDLAARDTLHSVVIERTPLEDELGDLLDKALRHQGLTETALADRAGVDPAKLRDAIDYRYDLSADELGRLAQALGLNEVGFRAIADGKYPLPDVQGLPFCLFPLRMPHGIGVVNAYVAADCSRRNGLLFDAGPGDSAVRRVWPSRIQTVDAIFITHPETEHVGGLAALRAQHPHVPVFAPRGARIAGAAAVGDGTRLEFGGFEIEVVSTPGHAEAHNCYVVTAKAARQGKRMLVSGDLIFAGSIGGAFFCRERLEQSVQRIFDLLPLDTVMAPGHGPLTTLRNEKSFNPFVR